LRACNPPHGASNWGASVQIADPIERRRVVRFVVVAVVTAVAVFVADALAKQAVTAALGNGDTHDVVPGWLVLTYVRNSGTAYGLLAGQGWLVLPLSIAAAVIVPLVLWRGGFWRGHPILGGLSAGLIFGGALGNLVERILTGAVTDFITVPPIVLFQVFNLADASICVGAVLLLLLGSTERSEPRAES
jgi:signal peptidase II